jgi:sortase A
LLLIYLPVLRAYFPHKNIQPNLDLSISIPKINAYAPLINDVDPWNEIEYKKALEKGVALAKGFSKPGENGTVYIFAHSSDSPWRITSYNTVFFRLPELQEGDIIQLNYNNIAYKYKVYDSLEVWPNEVEAITKAQGNLLILQTCTPIGTSLKRFLVFASPI